MAAESNTNAIADFDIDEVIDWDKHDIPSKDIEFDPLHSLNVQVSNVASTTTQVSSSGNLTSGGRDGLGLGNQLLAPPHREPGAAIIGMPQVPQSSAINPVFPGDPNSLIRDIRQEYLHAQNLTARSRTPPTPTFPSENFDLPPITPPGSIHSSFPAGQQPLRMALMSNLSRHANVQSQLPSFVPPNLPPAMSNVSMSQQLPPVVSEPLVDDSNIEELIDEIVERDMPQGVSEPIVFTPHVSQQPNPGSAHLQIASNALHKGLSPASVPGGSPGQLAVNPTNAAGKSQLPLGVVMGGSPLNAPSSPGSPLAPSRSPSPKVKQTNHTGKVSAPIRPANQAMRLTQPGSPLQNAPQAAMKSTRVFPVKTSQGLSNSQMLQMAVPSSVASVKNQLGSSQPHSLQVKSSVEAVNVNPQSPRETVTSSTVQTSVPQIQGQSISYAKVSPPKALQGSSINAMSVSSSGKPIQAIPIQSLASNRELLDQLVKAMGQPIVKPQSSTANIQTGQPLICYVVPQNSTPGAQVAQTKSSIPLSSSNHPVKMILVNANSPVKLPAARNTQIGQTSTTADVGLNCKPSLPSSQLAETKIALGSTLSPRLSNELTGAESGNLSAMSGIKSGTMIMRNNTMSSEQVTATMNNNQITTSIPSPIQPASPRFLVNNPSGKQNSISLGSAKSNTVPLLQAPLASGGNVVQITFVNEATAISKVVAAPSSTVLSSSSFSSGGSQSILAASQSSVRMPSPSTSSSSSSSHMLAATVESATPSDHQDSDEDDDDSKPLSQVAENLKKVGVTDDVKKKKKKKKDKEKGTKRKRKGKDSDILNKPLTAYELFFKETQAVVRTKNPLAQFEDIKKIVDQMWETLSESLKKDYQDKAQQQENQYQAKMLSLQNEPSAKLRKVETADAGPGASAADGSVAVEESTDTIAVTSNKPLSRAPVQTAMAGKPVATVTPMATTKSNSNQPSVPTKPKKGKVTVNPISQRICACDGCNKPARTTKERGTQYCSNECIVKHCRLAFNIWVTQRNEKAEANG